MKSNLLITGFLTLVAIAGCQSAPRPDQSVRQNFKRYIFTAATKSAIQKSVTSELKTPDSASTFGETRASISTEKVVMACGYLTAKTGHHQDTRKIIYQGIFEGGGFKVTGLGGKRSQDDAILSLCRENGIFLG